MYRSNNQRFYPVLPWAKIVTQVLSYKGTDSPTKRQFKTFMDTKGIRFSITYVGIQTKLRAAVLIPGKGQLGFRPMEMGAHSLCSISDKEMDLKGVTPLTIMMHYFCTFGNR